MFGCHSWLKGALLAGAVFLSGCGGSGQEAPGNTQAAGPKAAAAAGFSGNGTWWNPAEPGTGFFFEAQAGTGVLTLFVFDDAGKPAWYMAAGPVVLSPSGRTVFSGTIQRYAGGQPLESAAVKSPSSSTAGAVQVAFDGDTAHVMLPQRAFIAQRFNRGAQARPASGVQPETGIYWNPEESGRGYTIEINDDVATVGVFHYDAGGAPVWNLVAGNMATGTLDAPLQAYTGGQTLGGPYKPAATVPVSAALRAEFSDACTGSLVLPGRGRIAVRRFAFGSMGAGLECRSKTGLPGQASTALPVGTGVTDVQVTLGSPPRVDADLMLGRTMAPVTLSMSVTGSDAALAGKSFYAMVEDPDGLLESIQRPEVVGGNGRTLSSLLVPRRLATVGERVGSFRVVVCFDAECRQQLPSMQLPYRVNVRTVQTSKEAILVNSVPGQAPQTQRVNVTVPKGAIGFTMRLKTGSGTVASDAPPFTTSFPAAADTTVQALVSLPAAPVAGVTTNALVITLRFRQGEGVDEWVKEVPVYHQAATASAASPVPLPASELNVQLQRGSLAGAPLDPKIMLSAGAGPLPGPAEYLAYPPTAEGHPLARAWLAYDASQAPPFKAMACNPYDLGAGSCLPAGRYTARLPYSVPAAGGTGTAYQSVVLDVVP